MSQSTTSQHLESSGQPGLSDDSQSSESERMTPARALRERRVVVAFCGIMAVACFTPLSDLIPTTHLTPVRSSECTTYEVFDMDGMPLPVEMFGLFLVCCVGWGVAAMTFVGEMTISKRWRFKWNR